MILDDVKKNYIHSVAEFFEVHYAHMSPREQCPFSFTGRVAVSGVLTVIRNEHWERAAELKESLMHLAQDVAEYEAVLVVINNVVESFSVGGKEYSPLLALAAGDRGLALTEFAVGVNKEICNVIDYGVNSQMNEGVEGIHVAIGDGTTGFHIDFLSPAVKVIFGGGESA